MNAKVAGPRLGRTSRPVIKAVKACDVVVNADGTLTAGPAVLAARRIQLAAGGGRIPEYTAALPEGAGLVVLDGTVTEELEAEGWASDRIRETSGACESPRFWTCSDRISVVMAVPSAHQDWARTHSDLIAREIPAMQLRHRGERYRPARSATVCASRREGLVPPSPESASLRLIYHCRELLCQRLNPAACRARCRHTAGRTRTQARREVRRGSLANELSDNVIGEYACQCRRFLAMGKLARRLPISCNSKSSSVR